MYNVKIWKIVAQLFNNFVVNTNGIQLSDWRFKRLSFAHIGSNYEKNIEKVIKSNIFTREVFGYLSMI